MKRSDTDVKLKTIFQILDDKKGINISAFNVTQETGYTDYMVFVSGTSTQHNKTLSESVQRELKSENFLKPHIEGSDQARWILVDAGDVIIHVMMDELRHYYDLESLWIDAEQVDVYSILNSES